MKVSQRPVPPISSTNTNTSTIFGPIADLDGAGDISAAHVAEAIQYRSLDRSFH